ncbi:hypothetical protein G5I_03744 [Acromyrmex echinatior]|uniref:Uncharacterized protein n=1 Tax=Acromyrmex echinatior TaxID=103372 RepID=F4WDS9_ACREC|nr:hypothetical protein G5I_03744 [Acromyrmex echinatior]
MSAQHRVRAARVRAASCQSSTVVSLQLHHGFSLLLLWSKSGILQLKWNIMTPRFIFLFAATMVDVCETRAGPSDNGLIKLKKDRTGTAKTHGDSRLITTWSYMTHLVTTLIVLTQNFIPLKRFSSMVLELIRSIRGPFPPMTLSLTYVIKVMILSNLQQVLTIVCPLLKICNEGRATAKTCWRSLRIITKNFIIGGYEKQCYDEASHHRQRTSKKRIGDAPAEA